jgi:hypothetical protein
MDVHGGTYFHDVEIGRQFCRTGGRRSSGLVGLGDYRTERLAMVDLEGLH